jgi:hypothetical protein
MGPTYYMRLKHMVKDKVNYRALGPRTALTKQTVGGRANDGGLRIGEMERDTVISHGIAGFLQESMMERGDKYYMAICNHTGTISVYNPTQNLFMSPILDGPLRFVGSLDNAEELRLEYITKYGHSFSVVEVPYSFKLLMQELQTINVQMRVITEDNIDQITNMSSNHNIENLLGEDKTIRNLIDMVKKNIGTTRGEKIFTPDENDFTPSMDEEKSDSYHPITPDEKSDSYHPITPDEKSDSYHPITPDEKSDSYRPTSPDYPPPKKEEKGYLIDTPSSDDSYIPPPPPMDEESSSESMDNLQKGGNVCWKYDVQHPTRNWKIRHTGDKFITIQTDDAMGIDDPEDMVKVVRKDDLYSMAQAQQFAEKLSEISQPSQNPLSSGSGSAAPNIIIAPKFFNGNGSDNSMGGPEDGVNAPPIVPIVAPVVTNTNSSSSKETPSGEIDFSKEIKIMKSE